MSLMNGPEIIHNVFTMIRQLRFYFCTLSIFGVGSLTPGHKGAKPGTSGCATTPVCRGAVSSPGALKTQVLENASTEKASTKQRILQGWKTNVWKTQVQICRNGKRKYGKCKYNANLQSDKKKFGTSQISVVHLQVGVGKWTTDCFFSEIT